MKKDRLIQKIMHKVALREEGRLRKVWKIAFPILAILLIIFILSAQHTFYHMAHCDVFKSLTEIDYKQSIYCPNLAKSLVHFWNDIEKEVIVILLVSIAAITLLLVKTDLLSYPRRFREIKKYKKEEGIQKK